MFATFRLINSLPKEIVSELIRERESREKTIRKERNVEKKKALLDEERRRYFGYFDDYLDRITTDVCWLKTPSIAKIVYDAILFYDKKECDVVAFTVMPNHVHLVVDMQKENIPLHVLLRRIKTYSAKNANSLLKRKETFWHGENYDHVVRDGEELKRIINYVLNNPVKAKLCRKWEDWKWTFLDKKYL